MRLGVVVIWAAMLRRPRPSSMPWFIDPKFADVGEQD
jgi:hypothetical protein